MRRISRKVKIGGFDHVEAVTLGGGFPVVLQTMWKDRLSFSDLEKDAASIKDRIKRLGDMGCGLLRFAVPDLEGAEVLGRLAGMVSMPLVACIHFDYKIALRCLDFPIAKIRINPGNIGSADKIKAVAEKAAAKGRPIRIGVNGGSLPQDLRREVDSGRISRAEALVNAAERELEIFSACGFTDTLISVKASGIADTIKANMLLSARTDAPLHAGVTEAGPLVAGVVRNSAALFDLLSAGIVDTIRVSLSDSMENEIIAGREILLAVADRAADKSSGEKEKSGINGVTIVSCPRCGRHGFDTHSFTSRWLGRLYALRKDITVAVMGCAVNGPEEARHADIGITGAGDKVLIFSRGKVIRTINAAEADVAFEEELRKL